VVVQARLVLEAGLGRHLSHGHAGEPALGEAALGGVEDQVARRGRLTGTGDGNARTHHRPRI
jgi:hypothetical protein